MNEQLLKFHLDCKNEFTQILQDFNILFYGYGNKEDLLKKLFPGSIIINCIFMSKKQIIDDFKQSVIQNILPRKHKHCLILSMADNIFYAGLNKLLIEIDKQVLVILINFDRDLSIFMGWSNIRLVGTIESIDTNLTFDDVERYNFVFRDLTTYIPYRKEIMDIQVKGEASKVENVISVIRNVSKKSRNIFKAVISAFKEKRIFTMCDLIDKVGRKFLMKMANDVVCLLVEFFDHGILKKIGEDEIEILLSRKDIFYILENWDTTIN